jgi:drug/metabolite transporter (DMT)-like permease
VTDTPAGIYRYALLVGLGLMVVWGSSFAIQKQVMSTMSAAGFLSARYVVLSVCAATFLFQRYGLKWPPVSAMGWWALLRAALVGQVIHILFVTYGIDLSTAFSSSLIVACGPVFTLIVLRMLGIERLGRGQVLGVAIAFAGVLMFSAEKIARADWRASIGDLMILTATLLFSVYTVMAKPLMERHGAMVVVCYMTLLAAPVMLVTNGVQALSVDWAQVSLAVWVGFSWFVVVVSFLGWMVWGWVNGVRGVARSAPLLYLMPPVTGLIGWIAGVEHFSVVKIVGAVIALSGVAVAQLAARHVASPSSGGRHAQ